LSHLLLIYEKNKQGLSMRLLEPNKLSKADIEFVNDYFLQDTISVPTDIAIILGAQYAATQDNMAREAASLHLSGYFNQVAVSGGPVALGSTISEAEEMADTLRKSGLPSSAILIENEASNTQENIEFVRDLLKAQNIDTPNNTITCIGNAFGGRRILMTMKRRWPDMTPALKLIGPRADFKDTWQDFQYDREKICYEFNKLVPYTQKGFLEEVDIGAINDKLIRAKNCTPK
jgi:uncharacterized SAM-binding protein YcdF (DUF218 family)